VNRQIYKKWYGSAGEKHTADDWNRLIDNADATASEIGAVISLPPVTAEAGALTVSMANMMEECIADLSSVCGFPYAPAHWADGSSLSFADLNRWEYGIWSCYRKAGGAGRPEDTDTLETLLFPFSGWSVNPDGTFVQTVPSYIAAAGMNSIIGLTQHQADQTDLWSLFGPYVTAIGNGTVTVTCTGLMVGGKDLELTITDMGGSAVQYTANVPISGWINAGGGTVERTVSVPGLDEKDNGVIGYPAGDLAGALAAVAAGVIMIEQSAGPITLRADTVPSQAVSVVITVV
jgi:hypothetical protein